MSLTGPILPKAYGTPNVDAPTPTVATSIHNEIITCPKTGRMWVNWLDQAMVPIRPEFSFTNLNGETLAGVRSTLFGAVPFQSCGVEIYGGGLKVGRIESTGDVVSTSTMQCASFTMNGAGSFDVTTSSGAANAIHLRALKPIMSNDSTTATGANRYWFAVTNSLGCEFGDSGGAAGAYRLNALISGTKAQFERVVEANDGVRITDLPNTYRLGTDSSGNVVAGYTNNTDLTATLGADYTVTAANTLEELTDLRISVGAAGQTQIWVLSASIGANHNGNHDIEFKIRNHTTSTDLIGSKTSGAGYTSMSASIILTIIGSTQFRVYVQSTHTPVIKQSNSLGVNCTMLTAVRLG